MEEPLAEEVNAKHLEDLYAKSGIKDRDRSIEEELRKWEHQSSFDFPIHMNKQVKAYIVYFTTERKGFMARSLARSSRYLPMIKEIFKEYGLPTDLAYLAMVESGFNPKACSPAGACGMWQFIKGTGLRYGLTINGNIDERQDPEKSTRAAARYLLDLYKQFGSWYLAAASYNCGEGRVQKELTKSNYNNFWELSANKCIPGETRNYVPQMIAATIIARNPKKFGFTNVPYQSPLTPHPDPNIKLGQADSSGEPSRPLKSATVPKIQLAAPPSPQPRTAGVPKKKSTLHAQGRSQTAPKRVYAAAPKAQGQKAAKARPSPYTASLFGYPQANSKKTGTAKKSNSPARAQGTAKTKKSKSSPAIFAQKNSSKSTPSLKKSDIHKQKLSKTKFKPKSKALLVSHAR
ncbi:MAG: transglycosylase SLT domain-containing protein [Thermodesulfobacteriota bacterium]